MDQLMLEDIYDTQYKRVYNYISYRINNHMDIEDLVSLVFLKVIEKYDSYDPQRASLSTWVISIARNTVSDYFRAKTRNPPIDFDSAEPYLPSDEVPDSILIKNEQNLTLVKALNTLNARERNLIALKFGAELNTKEIARVMDLSTVNVGVIMFRSLRKLRAYFEKEESVCKGIAPKIGKTC
ncbi:MAG: sigma-70 family RNA polymerase sigma factor [Oscillospiraceae bacterium]